ncbi:MAG: family 1 encapsulin nanocompartment shell protein [Anaerolineae bacterium]|nr:bacteriocin family protein [Anaerolineae bacterium]MDW8069189.1 family 1 encapsulin nanocompartment shell protein [Anaerolineae bacterium]
MANKYLGREGAPFGEEVWAALDAAMIEAAKSQLAGRRLLPLEGPYGLGLKAIFLPEEEVASGVFVSKTLPLVFLVEEFVIPLRDIAAYEREGLALNLQPVAQAALAVACREDEWIFHGAAGVPGLLNASGVQKMKLSDWSPVGAAMDDLIRAVTILDETGFHGPYALGLAPARYNLLFRRYPDGPMTELDHVRTLVTGGIVKVPILKDGGVLLAVGRQYASIILGQDMHVGFIGPDDEGLEFTVSESLALHLRVPASVCVLE